VKPAPSRNSRGKFTRDLDHAERDGRACLLVSQGWTYDAVARELGYNDRGHVWRAVQAALVETASASGAAVLREQQLVEMAELKRRMWEIVNDPPAVVDRLGRPVKDEDGVLVRDAHAQVEAAAAIIRANDRISRLRGLDAPKRSVSASVNAGTGWGEIDALIQMAQAAIEARAAERAEHEGNVAMIAAAGRVPGGRRTGAEVIRAAAEVVHRQTEVVLADCEPSGPAAAV
jgi:hypothetical protein